MIDQWMIPSLLFLYHVLIAAKRDGGGAISFGFEMTTARCDSAYLIGGR
jgi:hypothetical protein